MAFEAATGYNQFPQGNWSPIKYSKKALMFFRTVSVVQDITNSDYEGEIKDSGDTVKIIKEPVITTRTYRRGAKVELQELDDQGLTLTVDQANYYAFPIDDIETRQSHIAWEAMAVSTGGYALRDGFDSEVLTYMKANATVGTSTTAIGTSGSPKSIGFGAGNDYQPADYLARLATVMDENNVPEEDRYIVANPAFYEQLSKTESKLSDSSYSGDAESQIRNRKLVTTKMVNGFKLYKSNNLAKYSSTVYAVLAGHKSAVATANNLTKNEKLRRTDTFGDMFRGLFVYGRKVLRPEALFVGYVTLGDA